MLYVTFLYTCICNIKHIMVLFHWIGYDFDYFLQDMKCWRDRPCWMRTCLSWVFIKPWSSPMVGEWFCMETPTVWTTATCRKVKRRIFSVSFTWNIKNCQSLIKNILIASYGVFVLEVKFEKHLLWHNVTLKRFITNEWPEGVFFVCLWVVVIWQAVQLWNQNAHAVEFPWYYKNCFSWNFFSKNRESTPSWCLVSKQTRFVNNTGDPATCICSCLLCHLCRLLLDAECYTGVHSIQQPCTAVLQSGQSCHITHGVTQQDGR